MASITQTAQWQALQAHRQQWQKKSLRQLFAEDARRVHDFSLELPGLYADYSRNLIDRETLGLLLQLAESAGLGDERERLFNGSIVNSTEQRAALHTLLRRGAGTTPTHLRSHAEQIADTLGRMREFSEQLRHGTLHGARNERFTDIVNIGIGGSHLGPEMVLGALTPSGNVGPRVHFISNVDPAHVARVLAPLDPAHTLVIVASKTFTTQETLANARSARAWLVGALGEAAVARHFVAVSAATQKAVEFGIAAERIFGFWDWVGGRYSLWSAVGLSISVGLGFDKFEALLQGAARMDAHFRDAPTEENLPVILALLGIWYVNFWQAGTRAVIPYRQDLHLLVPYLQQLEMESCGKRVRRDGEDVDYATAPVIWGDVGTNGQHAFFQLLHQGTPMVPVDFIAVVEDAGGNRTQQHMLLSNCFAQAEALMLGRSLQEAGAGLSKADAGLAAHKTFPGNRPSTLLLLDRLDAGTLGMLIALYEHRTFVQSCIWDINPFDQMGVELGKQLAERVLKALDSSDPSILQDAASRAAVAHVLKVK